MCNSDDNCGDCLTGVLCVISLGFQFCLRRKLPVPGTKGGIFCVCVESINLTVTHCDWLIIAISEGILECP